MKYITAIKSALILSAVLLLNSVAFVGHTSAMSTMSHDMGGMSHNSSDTSSCSTLCRTAIVNREENAVRNDENEDDGEEWDDHLDRSHDDLLDKIRDEAEPPPSSR